MPTIFAASETTVMINQEPVEGVKVIEYRFEQSRLNVYALGSVERIGMISGPNLVEGRLRVVSTQATLNALTTETQFNISAVFKHGNLTMEVAFDECYLTEKHFEMSVGGTGEAVYSFTATRVREAAPQAATS